MNHTTSDNSTKAMEILTRMFKAEMEFMESETADFTGVKTIFHPDVVIHEPASLPYAGDWHGYDMLGQLFNRMHETWDPMTVENMRATIDGDTLFMSCTLVATARHSGQKIRQPFAQILTIKDGLVIEGFPYYFDTVEINVALGYKPDETKENN